MGSIKKIVFALIILLIPFFVEAKEVTINLFRGEGCPHCAEEEKFLENLKKEYCDKIEIEKYEVWYDEDNSHLLDKVKDKLDVDISGVPFTVIGNQNTVGYNENISSEIRKMIDDALEDDNYVDVVSLIKEDKEIPSKENNDSSEDGSLKSENKKDNNSEEEKTVPLLGNINVKEVSLPLVGAAIGLVDGFNPCAMWILLFLISMLLPMKNKKRKWTLGITFLVTSALCYTLFMVAWLNIALTAMQTTFIRNIIAVVALIGAFVNLRSYIKSNDSGCTVVKDNKRKKIFDRIKKITKEKSFFLALLGIMVLAFSVNLVELACSAGLPLLYTSILAMNDLNVVEYAFNIFVYIFFFLIDDIIVFIIAMKTLEVTGISTKYGKFSHLIGGILMLLIGMILILKPEWLMFGF